MKHNIIFKIKDAPVETDVKLTLEDIEDAEVNKIYGIINTINEWQSATSIGYPEFVDDATKMFLEEVFDLKHLKRTHDSTEILINLLMEEKIFILDDATEFDTILNTCKAVAETMTTLLGGKVKLDKTITMTYDASKTNYYFENADCLNTVFTETTDDDDDNLDGGDSGSALIGQDYYYDYDYDGGYPYDWYY